MLGGADHIEDDSPSEHGNETPRPRTRPPSASTTIDYRSPAARTATTPTRPAKPSRRRRRYQLENTVLSASTPGIQLRLTPRYHHRDYNALLHPEWNDIVRGQDTGTGWLKITCMREPELLPELHRPKPVWLALPPLHDRRRPSPQSHLRRVRRLRGRGVLHRCKAPPL